MVVVEVLVVAVTVVIVRYGEPFKDYQNTKDVYQKTKKIQPWQKDAQNGGSIIPCLELWEEHNWQRR